MKKILLIIMLITLTNAAHTTTKCVALDPDITTCSLQKSRAIKGWWSSVCTTLGTSFWIGGPTRCSAESGTLGETKRYNVVDTSPVVESNRYCWCMMISPTHSDWVFAADLETASNCLNGCNEYCYSRIADTPAFRSAILFNISHRL